MRFWHFLKRNSLIILILILGFFLFSWRLSEIPNGLYSDEAVVGYDAYSMVNTLKDHYGKTLPIYFKFFGSFTPGLFVYLQCIPVKLMGLNIFSVRILSVLSMLMVAIAIYLFWKENKFYKNKYLPIFSVFLFMITPWVLFNARIGYETTFAFMLISLGILFYKRPMLSFFLISLSTYASHSQRYLAPMVIILIVIFFYRNKESAKGLFRAILVALILQIPNLFLFFTPSFWVKGNSLTNNFLSQYLSYFLPFNLFNGLDFDLQRSMPELSVFYSWMFIPWIFGFYSIYKNWKNSFYKFLLFLTLISPVPAALANTNYSTQRALMLLLPYSLIISLGIDEILAKIKNKFYYPLIGLLIIYSLILLWRSYFVLMPVERAEAWNYGYQELSNFILLNEKEKFVVDNSRGVPYIELLFFMNYDPKKIQKENIKLHDNYYGNLIFSGNLNFKNVEVRNIDWKNDIYKDQILVGDELSISEDQIEEHFLIKVFEVTDIHGKVLIQGYKTNPELKRESEKLKAKKNNKIDIIEALHAEVAKMVTALV